jgi:hypothetical protein
MVSVVGVPSDAGRVPHFNVTSVGIAAGGHKLKCEFLTSAPSAK